MEITNQWVVPEGTETSSFNTMLNICCNIPKNCPVVFLFIVKSRLISKTPNLVQHHIQKIQENTKVSTRGVWKVLEINEGAHGFERQRQQGTKEGQKEGPNTFNPCTMEKAMIKCLVSRAGCAAGRINISPVPEKAPNRNCTESD